MKCPECLGQEKTSTVTVGGSSSTLLGGGQPTFDPDGRRHHHNPNTTTTTYSCSNGHGFVVSGHAVCWCGWGKDRWKVGVIVPGGRVALTSGTAEKVKPITDKHILKAMFEVT